MLTREVVHVRGMSCASCAAGLERVLARLPGVQRASVSYAAERATIDVSSPDVRAAIEGRIRDRGYEVVAADVDTTSEEGDRLLVRLVITVFFTMMAMMPAAVVLLGVTAAGSIAVARLLALASAVLALPAILVGGLPPLRRALRSLRNPGMDLLIAAGALVTYGYSLVVLVRGGHAVYFDTAAMIVSFALLGRVLEERARRRGIGAVRALDALLPRRAHLAVGQNGEQDVAVEALAVGDLVRVRAGERVPIDGLVREGTSLADAAVLTGEWAPRATGVGERIAAGLLLLDGTLLVEVERPVGQREVDLIRRAVDGLLSSRAPMQRIADALAARLAWTVLALASLTLVGTGLWIGFGAEAWMRAVAVVVVACPCALGLATPMAIAVAAGRAASRGILFRDGEAIELAARIDRVLLDKTGTLTEGRPRVTSVTTDLDREQILRVASLLESAVHHPIARALREAAPPADLRMTIEVVPGGGVIGRGAETWMIGSARFLRERGIAVAHELDEIDATTVHVARDGLWAARITLDDALRPPVAAAVRSLVDDGLRPMLVTGDVRSVAERVARAAGIRDVHAQTTPVEKAEIVRAARADGARVAFVGDGLNDGPALAAADLGIAVDSATDLAAECARIVLVEGGVERVGEALAIARATRRRMRQNLTWALVYNVLAIPAAALGWISPSLAAAAMAASSLSIVGNSLRADQDSGARHARRARTG
jgi:heavy metal translocating P-type ATPase